MENGEIIVDEGDAKTAFFILQNALDDLDLDPYEFRVYAHYKRVAGEGGSCFQKTATILKKIKMSQTKFIEVKKSLCKPRPELGGRSLIRITQRFKPDSKERDTDLITITNIWDVDLKKISTWCATRTTPGTPHAPRGAPGVEKEDSLKKISEETTTGEGQLLSLFDKRKEIFKGISDDEIKQVKETFEACKTPIANPDGWIAQCLREGWHKKKMSIIDIQKRNRAIGDRMEPAKKLFAAKNLSVTSSPTTFEVAYVGAQKEPTIFSYTDPLFEDKIRKFFSGLGIPVGECVVDVNEKGDYVASFKRS